MPDQPSREGTVAITAHLAPEVRKRLKILAARKQRTMNELIAEALEDLFKKRWIEFCPSLPRPCQSCPNMFILLK